MPAASSMVGLSQQKNLASTKALAEEWLAHLPDAHRPSRGTPASRHPSAAGQPACA